MERPLPSPAGAVCLVEAVDETQDIRDGCGVTDDCYPVVCGAGSCGEAARDGLRETAAGGARAAAKQAPAPAAAKPQPVPASAKQAPALTGAKQQPAAASADKKATPQTAPSAGVAAAKPGEPAKQPANASAVKTAPVLGKSTGKPPAPPKTPSVKLNPVVTASSKPLPGKAVVASAGNAPVPAAAAKASATSLSALQLKVQSSKTLISALQPKLSGVDVVSAADGFKDLQQFVSAVHASHNLGVRFDSLKTKLLTGKRANLRQAIQELRPAASAAIESQRAQYDADGHYP